MQWKQQTTNDPINFLFLEFFEVGLLACRTAELFLFALSFRLIYSKYFLVMAGGFMAYLLCALVSIQ